MSSVVLSAPARQHRHLDPLRGARVAACLLAATCAVACVWLAMPRLRAPGVAPGRAWEGNGFADGRFPVRGIERAPALKSGNRLVRVRCGGAAAKTSYCWIAKR